VRIERTPLRLALRDTAAPTHPALQRPQVLILCFDIARRATLAALQTAWRPAIEAHVAAAETELPILLLGLKRDRRRAEWTPEQRAWVLQRGAGMVGEGEDERGGGDVMPQEGLSVAQSLRLDVYAECSAETGELCREVMEDIAKLALKVVRGETGGGVVGAGCVVS
jgi:Ras homolog gene family, member A